MKLTIPDFLISSFRTNHAGETGAVFIYKAIPAIKKTKGILHVFSKLSIGQIPSAILLF